jgi:hypothetical protein
MDERADRLRAFDERRSSINADGLQRACRRRCLQTPSDRPARLDPSANEVFTR